MSQIESINKNSKPTALQKYMEKNNLKREKFAESIGISISYLSYLLNRKRTLGKNKALEVSKKTGIPLEDLIT